MTFNSNPTNPQGALTCPRCGAKNPLGEPRCFNCGSPLFLPGETRCPACQAARTPTAQFCSSCGYRFPAPPALQSTGPGLVTPGSYPREGALPGASYPRTLTGLLLLIIGFALIWIPDVGIIGDLLAFIGIIFMFLGRHEVWEPHPRYVVRGSVLLLVAIVLDLGLTVWFVAAIIGAASPGSTPSQLGSTLTSDLGTLFVGVVVVGALALIAEILIVYAIADVEARRLLWSAFAIQLVISVLLLSIIYPQVSAAVTQATNGTTVNTAPITALQSKFELYSLLNAIPTLMFAYTYYRIRDRLKRGLTKPPPFLP